MFMAKKEHSDNVSSETEAIRKTIEEAGKDIEQALLRGHQKYLDETVQPRLIEEKELMAKQHQLRQEPPLSVEA